jgi:hypothetical protein
MQELKVVFAAYREESNWKPVSEHMMLELGRVMVFSCACQRCALPVMVLRDRRNPSLAIGGVSVPFLVSTAHY